MEHNHISPRRLNASNTQPLRSFDIFTIQYLEMIKLHRVSKKHPLILLAIS